MERRDRGPDRSPHARSARPIAVMRPEGRKTNDSMSFTSVATVCSCAAGTVIERGAGVTRFRAGDRIVVPHDGYGGSWRLFNALAYKAAFELVTVDLTDPRALAAALAERPAVVWIETPSNPLLRITDLRFVIEAAHAAGALAVVDNTFLSPALQQPIAFGADVVVHSTTKYINGHSDVVGGAVVSASAALHERLSWWANCLGITGSPFDSFMTLRGLRTLDARLRVHQENTAALVELLDGHAAVRALHWPGRAAHPGHLIAARQQSGFGAMLSVEIEGGEAGVEQQRGDALRVVRVGDGERHLGARPRQPPERTGAD